MYTIKVSNWQSSQHKQYRFSAPNVSTRDDVIERFLISCPEVAQNIWHAPNCSTFSVSVSGSKPLKEIPSVLDQTTSILEGRELKNLAVKALGVK